MEQGHISFLKDLLIFNLFENIYKKEHKTTTNETFYTDLDVFNNNSVFNVINKTKTIFGEIKLGILLYSPIDDIIKLQKRQNIIKQLSLVYKNINPILDNVKKKENDILWLLKEKNEEEAKKTFKYLEEIGELGELEDVEDYLPEKDEQ